MIEIRVLGVPWPQGSKSAVVVNGQARLLEGSSKTGRAKHKAWRQSVAAEAQDHALEHGPVDENAPLEVDIVFVMPKPKSKPKKAIWCQVKPDLDKLIRSTLDGLADGGLVAHDSRVVKVTAEKRYVVPGEGTGALIAIQGAQQVTTSALAPAADHAAGQRTPTLLDGLTDG